jgi:hypothetical protein
MYLSFVIDVVYRERAWAKAARLKQVEADTPSAKNAIQSALAGFHLI